MWPFRKKPLSEIAGRYTDPELIDEVFNRIPRTGDMSQLEQGVFAFWWLGAECRNGTIEQYFTNSAADDLPRMQVFLESCGAQELLSALKSMATHFSDGDGDLLPREKRNEIVSKKYEENEKEWETTVRNQNNQIMKAFESVKPKVGAHIRHNLGK